MSRLQDVLRVVIVAITISLPVLPSRAASYYVDYSGGADTNPGTGTSSAWQHCPGDPAATGMPASTPLNPGDTVFFKGGSNYVLTAQNPSQYWWPNEQQQGGILMNWSGTSGAPITYNGSNGWGVGRCTFTDNYTSNGIVAFWSTKGVSNLVFNGFVFGPIGGLPTLPADTGSALPPMAGFGIQAESMTNVTVASCYFHDLGLNFEAAPQGGGSFAGTAIGIYDSAGVVVTNCEFTRMDNALEVASFVGTTNLTVEYCYFHNDIVWNIDLPVDGCAGTYRDAIYIHHNLFQNFDVTYAAFTGYGSSPHYDGIIDRAAPSACAGGSTCNFTDGPNIDIYGNTFNDTSSINAASTACIFLTGSTSANVYNNLFVDNASSDSILYLSQDGYNHSNIYVRAYNNTSYNSSETFIAETSGDGSGCAEAYPANDWGNLWNVDVKNNILYDCASGYTISFNIEATNTSVTSYLKLNNDDLFRTNGYSNYMYWDPLPSGENTYQSFSSMQGNGWELNGQTADPRFVGLPYGSWSPASISNNYQLLADSPCIGAGTNLSALGLPGLNADRNGNPRPASGPWDIGAYEYNTNSVAPTPPAAVFSAAPTSGTVPLTVTFTDTSTGSITSRAWQFGNGTVTNTTATSIVYQYAAPGTDTVQLIVSGPGGSSTNMQANLIAVGNTNSVAPTPPVASFGAVPTSGTVPLTVTFTDTSTGSITSRAWQFGNGTVTNTTSTSVVYQYTAPGTDTVQLIVTGPGGSSTNVQANLITVGNTNSVSAPVASFSAAPTSGTVPLTVTFTDTSTGSITSRAWQFGNGTVTNTTSTSVVYQYTAPGTDTVQLIVTGPGGSSTNVQANLITVGNTNSVSAPVASFSAAPTSGTVPLTVTFTDTSTGSITNRLWHFGDGTSSNTLGTTMVHQYTIPGTNSVRLNVYGPGGGNMDSRIDLIAVSSNGDNTNSVPPPVASFGATPTSGTVPLTVTFTDTSTGPITNRVWHFGDGTSANTFGATIMHQYATAGTNSVQLVVSGPGGTGVDSQGNLIIVNPTLQSGGGTNNVPQIGDQRHWRFLFAY